MNNSFMRNDESRGLTRKEEQLPQVEVRHVHWQMEGESIIPVTPSFLGMTDKQ